MKKKICHKFSFFNGFTNPNSLPLNGQNPQIRYAWQKFFIDAP